MPETVNLAQPYGAVTSSWQIKSVTLERGFSDAGNLAPNRSLIRVIFSGENQQQLMHQWSGVEADGLIIALNKANLSVKSLNTRIFERAIADNVFAGTLSGSSD